MIFAQCQVFCRPHTSACLAPSHATSRESNRIPESDYPRIPPLAKPMSPLHLNLVMRWHFAVYSCMAPVCMQFWFVLSRTKQKCVMCCLGQWQTKKKKNLEISVISFCQGKGDAICPGRTKHLPSTEKTDILRCKLPRIDMCFSFSSSGTGKCCLQKQNKPWNATCTGNANANEPEL